MQTGENSNESFLVMLCHALFIFQCFAASFREIFSGFGGGVMASNADALRARQSIPPPHPSPWTFAGEKREPSLKNLCVGG